MEDIDTDLEADVVELFVLILVEWSDVLECDTVEVSPGLVYVEVLSDVDDSEVTNCDVTGCDVISVVLVANVVALSVSSVVDCGTVVTVVGSFVDSVGLFGKPVVNIMISFKFIK